MPQESEDNTDTNVFKILCMYKNVLLLATFPDLG